MCEFRNICGQIQFGNDRLKTAYELIKILESPRMTCGMYHMAQFVAVAGLHEATS